MPQHESFTFNLIHLIYNELHIDSIRFLTFDRQLVVNQVDKVESETFVLRHPDHSFTKEYKEFLKDYYLD